jgi:hypothetical protein
MFKIPALLEKGGVYHRFFCFNGRGDEIGLIFCKKICAAASAMPYGTGTPRVP